MTQVFGLPLSGEASILSFPAYMRMCDVSLVRRLGMGTSAVDIPEWEWREYYNSGMSVDQAIEQVLTNLGVLQEE